MQYEVKITKLDNGFLLKVIDLEGDRRKPVKKMVALDTLAVKGLLDDIYK